MQKHIETLLSLWRKNGKSNYLSNDEIKKLGAALLKLQRGLTGDRNLAGKNYMQDPMFFGAYLLYYWPVSYIQIQKIVQTISIPVKESYSLLECGAGPAPGTCALLDAIFSANPQAKVQVYLVDSSAQALSTADRIIKKDYNSVSVKTKVMNLEKDFPDAGQFDFILLSHVLNELWKNENDRLERRFNYLSVLSTMLCEGGRLILNEPSVLEASRNLIQLRDMLLEKGMKLLSPCPSSDCNKCPVLETPNHTCHGEYFINGVRVLEDLSRQAGLKRVSVKMSFFVFASGDDENCQASKTVACKNEGMLCGKIVSEGMLNKSGRVRFLVCDGEKRIPLSAKQDDSNAKAQGFFKLKRYDEVQVVNPEVRENGYGMTGAELKVVEA